MNQIALSVAASSKSLTMTSREIAELTGKQHAHVMRDIRVMMEALEQNPNLDSFCKTTTYEGANGIKYEQYELNQNTCLTLLLGYDPVARMKVVQRWRELEETQKAKPAVSAVSPAAVLSDSVAHGLLSKASAEAMMKAWLYSQHPCMRDAKDVSEAPAAPAKLRLPSPAKPTVKRKPAPQPIKLTHVPFNGFDGLNFIASDIEGYVVGGIRELKRAMRDFELISETGEPTAKGRGLVSGKTPHGPRWKVGALLNYLSGRPA